MRTFVAEGEEAMKYKHKMNESDEGKKNVRIRNSCCRRKRRKRWRMT